MEQGQQRTKEQILKAILEKYCLDNGEVMTEEEWQQRLKEDEVKRFIQAMEEYASSQLSALREENETLRLAYNNSQDVYKKTLEFYGPLNQSLSEENRKLKEENEKLRKGLETEKSYRLKRIQEKFQISQNEAMMETAIPSDETLAAELIARFFDNSRGNPISKKAFVDGVLWIKERIESLLNDTGKNG